MIFLIEEERGEDREKESNDIGLMKMYDLRCQSRTISIINEDYGLNATNEDKSRLEKSF